MNKFSNKTIKALGYYVYVYSDPDTHKPFYVGKGKGNRAFEHLSDDSDSRKTKEIELIRARGKEPLIEILVHGLDEKTAFKVEAATIDLLGVENLTNQVRGHGSSEYGKIEASVLESRYMCEELCTSEIEYNVLMIRINALYRNDMTPIELYDATRGYWKVNIQQAQKVEYVFAVYDGMVMEVYKPTQWFPGLSTYNSRDKSLDKKRCKSRYEFVGSIADDDIRNKYIGKNVSKLFAKGEQNPIKYIWK